MRLQHLPGNCPAGKSLRYCAITGHQIEFGFGGVSKNGIWVNAKSPAGNPIWRCRIYDPLGASQALAELTQDRPSANALYHASWFHPMP
jgi:hypothetical protein